MQVKAYNAQTQISHQQLVRYHWTVPGERIMCKDGAAITGTVPGERIMCKDGATT